MNKEFKIYHTETQEDYDDLMIKLENEGFLWASGDKPTSGDYWSMCGRDTIVYLGSWGEDTITRSNLSGAKKKYPTIPIIKHKAKGVEQMEKVVVPQFVADWYEKNKNGVTIYGLLHLFSDNYFLYDGFRKWVKDYNINESEAQDIIAKMYLFQDYEIEVEEEKKYYWRKKKEYYLDFEYDYDDNYINLDIDDNTVTLDDNEESDCFRTKFTETEIKKLVSEEDFNKLEKVEIADDER